MIFRYTLLANYKYTIDIFKKNRNMNTRKILTFTVRTYKVKKL